MSPVHEFYRDAQKEWDRLDIPICRIEFASTLALIDSYFKKGVTVADIGGGPGRYMIELLNRGCHVTLFDLTAENIVFARAKVAELGLSGAEFVVGDARDLSALDGKHFDAILALGPLYHIFERQERIAFLRAVKSLLTPRGILISAYLNAWGIARTLLTDGPWWFRDRRNLVYVTSGGAFVDAQACAGFTECFWSTPDGAQQELRAAGFDVLEEIGAEGFAGGLRNEVAAIAKDDQAAFDQVVALAVATSKLPHYRRATDHLLLVARA